MTVALFDFPTLPTAREMMDHALQPHILLGMPHLTPQGLSETWLMKEIGHRHWLMLARDMGMDNADFRTLDDSAVYAAICATSLRNARLDHVSANDVMTIRSTLSAVSRTQMSSRHGLFVGMTKIADVELLSTFVHRLKTADNYSIARVSASRESPARFTDNELARSAAEMRAEMRGSSGEVVNHLPVKSFTFRTSPSQEFNGAGLFYFAEFQALMDRAHEQDDSSSIGPSYISDRNVFFFGNVRENEIVKIEIHGSTAKPFSSSCRVYREDGKIIALAQCFRKSL